MSEVSRGKRGDGDVTARSGLGFGEVGTEWTNAKTFYSITIINKGKHRHTFEHHLLCVSIVESYQHKQPLNPPIENIKLSIKLKTVKFLDFVDKTLQI